MMDVQPKEFQEAVDAIATMRMLNLLRCRGEVRIQRAQLEDHPWDIKMGEGEHMAISYGDNARECVERMLGCYGHDAPCSNCNDDPKVDCRVCGALKVRADRQPHTRAPLWMWTLLVAGYAALFSALFIIAGG